MNASEIVRIRSRIGEEYKIMANSFDRDVIAERAQAIEMLCQELMEACSGEVA